MRNSLCSRAPGSLYLAYGAMFIGLGVSQPSFTGAGMAFLGLALASLVKARRQ